MHNTDSEGMYTDTSYYTVYFTNVNIDFLHVAFSIVTPSVLATHVLLTRQGHLTVYIFSSLLNGWYTKADTSIFFVFPEGH